MEVGTSDDKGRQKIESRYSEEECPMPFVDKHRMIRTEIEKRFPGDHPPTVAVREYLATACEQLVQRGLADPKYTSELTSG